MTEMTPGWRIVALAYEKRSRYYQAFGERPRLFVMHPDSWADIVFDADLVDTYGPASAWSETLFGIPVEQRIIVPRGEVWVAG